MAGSPSALKLAPGVPAIAPVPAGSPRPFWSVMIPVRHRTTFFIQAIDSVLAQDPGPAEMEIWLVDNSERTIDFLGLLSPRARKRVRYHRQIPPLGIADNWTSCVRLSRGHYVHLLNDDDYVLPGFYARLGAMARLRPEVGLLGSASEVVNGEGIRQGTAPAWPEWSTPSRKVLTMINTFENPLRTPSIVMRRATYERIGGFQPGLTHYLDWEMWLRAAHADGAWMTPEALACYRVHDSNDTLRAQQHGEDLLDFSRCVSVLQSSLPGFDPRPLRRHVALLSWARWQSNRHGDAMTAESFRRVWKQTASSGLRLRQQWELKKRWLADLRFWPRMFAGRIIRVVWPARK